MQHWAEKVYLPTSLDACPLAESIRELCQAVSEFVTITKRDILEGLEMERPIVSHWPPPVTLFSWVLGPPNQGTRENTCCHWNSPAGWDAKTAGQSLPILSCGPNSTVYPLTMGSHNTDISTHQSTGGRATFLPCPEVLPTLQPV